MRPPFPDNENARVAALRRLDITNSDREESFDHIVRLAAALFNAPIALVSLVDSEHQFFKARVGLDVCGTPRDISFCAHAVAASDVLIVPDAMADERFKENPLVTSAPYIRFYAGAPLVTRAGYCLGSVCIIDTEPRAPLNSEEVELLRSLAAIAMNHLEGRRLDAVRRAAFNMTSATVAAMIAYDQDGSILFWNKAAERIFGYSREQALGRSLDMIIPEQDQALHHAYRRAAKTDCNPRFEGNTLEMVALRKDGGHVPVEYDLLHWWEGDQLQFAVVIRDISERRSHQGRIERLAYFDTLTGLPNRVAFLQRIEEGLSNLGAVSVLKIGLDGFKAVNGSAGMAAGDAVLLEAGKRVEYAAGSNAYVARLGGDEFGVLFSGSDDPLHARDVADRVRAGLEMPYRVQGGIFHLGASAGICLAPGLGAAADGAAVLRSALLALQEAKSSGGRKSALFRPQMSQEATARRKLDSDLREALKGGQFELRYQPQARLSDGAVVGAEALLRWRHPQWGLMSPASFLPALENMETVAEVGTWILHEACGFAAEMLRMGRPIKMGVNLFGSQLLDGGLDRTVDQVLAETHLPSELLELEITETTLIGLDEAIVAPLRSLRARGVGIAFDDYGTGFASLSWLKRYPLSRLKIDREFVCNLENDRDDAAIVRAVLAMGASLGLQVIAEGIETEEQARILASLGCEEGQGYLFGKPLAAEDFRQQMSGLIASSKPDKAARRKGSSRRPAANRRSSARY